MYQLIDIEEEKSTLWQRLFCSLRDVLHLISNVESPFSDVSLPSPIVSLYVDIDDNIVANLRDGQMVLIEELEDDTMYSIYECVLSRLQEPS